MEYHIEERLLKNKDFKKVIPIIVFEEAAYQLLGEFIMADGMLLMEQLLLDLETLEKGDRKIIKTSGNRCGLEMTKDYVLIYDLFEDMPGVTIFPEVKISPNTLKSLLFMWEEVKSHYR